MSTKSIIWIFMFIGSTIGGFIPTLWDAGFLSFSSLLLTAVGGLLGIWLAFNMNQG